MGMGLYVGPYCMDLAISKAKKYGLGFVACRNSTHYGIAGGSEAQNILKWQHRILKLRLLHLHGLRKGLCGLRRHQCSTVHRTYLWRGALHGHQPPVWLAWRWLSPSSLQANSCYFHVILVLSRCVAPCSEQPTRCVMTYREQRRLRHPHGRALPFCHRLRDEHLPAWQDREVRAPGHGHTEGHGHRSEWRGANGHRRHSEGHGAGRMCLNTYWRRLILEVDLMVGQVWVMSWADTKATLGRWLWSC